MKRYQVMAGLPMEIEVYLGGRYVATIRGHVDSIRGSGGSMATALRVVATDMEMATDGHVATESEVRP